MADKKISELTGVTTIHPDDISVLVSNGTDHKFAFSTLLQFLGNNLLVGTNLTFGTTLPQNTVGKNGDVFVNSAVGSFAQRSAGVWNVVYTLPSTSSSTDGTVLYGLGIPGPSDGNNNDTYIDTSTGIFYKKASGTWGQVFSMQTGPQGPAGPAGTNGTNGTNGFSILNGTTNPSNLSTGVNGDLYINTSNYTLFGPKAAGVWPTGVSLIGPAGAAGSNGTNGINGTNGTNGFGVPAGGTAGQVLSKVDGVNYNTRWVTQSHSESDITIYYNVETYGAIHDGNTDDTPAIQAAINAANLAGGGVVYFPKGTYAINSPVLDSDSNSQIVIPVHLFADSISHNHIKLLGEIAPNYYSQPFANGTAPPNTGVVLKSNLSGAVNVIGSKTASSPWGNFNYCHLEIENITIRLKSKTGSANLAAAATAINAARLAYLSLLNVRIDTESDQANIVQPLSTSKGVITPFINNFVMVNIDKCYVVGVYTAFEISEHANLDNIFIDGCYEGLSFNTSYHPALVNKICIARTKINIVVKGVMPFTITQLAIEDYFEGGRWITNLYDLDERVLGSQAYIRFSRVISGVGIDNSQFLRSTSATSGITAEIINASSSRLVLPNPQIGDYTITATDSFKLISINKAATSALYLSHNSAVPFAIGTEMKVAQLGAGSINITGNTGVVILSNSNKFSTNGKGSVAKLIKIKNNTWLLTGDLIATGNGGGDPDPGSPSDTDAQAFIATTGIDDPTEQEAITNLVVELKNNSLWTKLKAIYPFVGSAEAPCSYNLKNTAQYRLVFNGVKAFDITGYRPDGATSYANTGLNPSVVMSGSQNSFHFSFYSGLATNNGGSYIGCYNAGIPISQMELAYSGTTNYTSVNSSRGGSGTYAAPIGSTFKGLWLANRNNSANETIDKDGTLFGTATYVSSGVPNANFYIGSNNNSTSGSPSDFTNSNCGFASIGDGFTDAEKALFATVITSFINALSR